MIITKTPLRITFTGGGSDIPSYFEKHGGHCINAAINKYVYVLAKRRDDNKIYLKYSENEVVDVDKIDDIKHDFIRETLNYLEIDYGLEIINWADIPTKGSGLGSSSSFLVGLLHALNCLEGNDINKEMLAQQASYIEMVLCNKPIGYQDQYAASYGGLNKLTFENKCDVKVEKININYDLISDNILLFYTGITRESSSVLTEQKENLKDNKDVIKSMKLNVELSKWLSEKLSTYQYDSIGYALNTNWELKKNFSSNIINDKIENIYNVGISEGASGGKIIGAGGGGYVLFYVNKSKQDRLINALSHYSFMKINIDKYGSRVLLNLGE